MKMSMNLRLSILGSAVALLGYCPIPALAQGRSANQSQPASGQPTDQKQDNAKKKINERQVLKELATPYKKWLSEDVVYIISDTERRAFLQLQTNEERE